MLFRAHSAARLNSGVRLVQMIPRDVQNEILRRLAAAEAQHGVRILMAIESGSRAWGFSSPNSDFDVRFIYARPAHWYSRIDLEEKRDVIEYGITDDIDLNGWDVRKALRLFWKTNPAFIEWIQSPIRYVVKGEFLRRSNELLPTIYCAERGVHHYRSMAKTNYRGYLREQVVPLKKYFYSLRPLLAVRWIEAYGTPPPIEFEKLMERLEDEELILSIDALLDQKRASPELGVGNAVPQINQFIEQELSRLDKRIEKISGPRDIELLNALFNDTISEQV